MEHDARNVRLYLRVNKNEYGVIKEKAKLSGLSVSEYVRRLTLGFQVCSRFELNVLNELRRQGGLIKHIHNESHGIYDPKMTEALEAIISCANKLERKLS
ncbi:MAG: MobB mobilization protein [Synergistaceae bacterium]|nr:MobB mobilization protein [Synergistaceae bacterium]